MLLQKNYSMQKLLFIFQLCWLVSCDSSNSSEQGTAATTPTASIPKTDTKRSVAPEPTADSLTPRSIDARLPADWDFAKTFPILHGILSSDPLLLAKTSSYAESVVTGKGLNSDTDVEELLSQAKALRSEIGELVEAWDQEREDMDQLNALDQEFTRLGMRAATSEGIFVMLVATDMPPTVLQACSPAMRAHLTFMAAADNTIGGEYPYSNMSLFANAVAAGEQNVIGFAKNPWAEKDKTTMAQMLRAFVGIYLHRDGDYETAAVGYPGDGMYEFAMSELESHKEFIQQHPNSQFTPIVSALLENTSTSAFEPEQMYVVYASYFESEEEAQRYQYDKLLLGEDMLHILPVRLGNGKLNWLVSYRFYDDSEKATAFFTQKEQNQPEVKMMLCTWHNDEFVQSGI
jgi:hypothetical protein